MKKEFAKQLYRAMQDNDKIVVITADLGYGMWDHIRNMFPDRFFNVGAAEFTMVSIACGMALEGKIPFVYTITPFYYRAFELLRTYVNHEDINIKLVGSGRDKDYAHDGYSHDASDFKQVLDTLPKIKQYWPEDKEFLEKIVEDMVQSDKPSFVSLRR